MPFGGDPALGETVRKIVTAAREGVLAYEKKERGPRSWSAYDLAQTREIADTLELTRHLVDAAAERLASRAVRRARQRGRPPTPAADIAKVLIMQTYFGVPNRVAEGLLLLFGEKLGISHEFSYKTIERGYDREAVNRLLDKVVELTNVPIQGLEKVFSVDGTGMPSSRKENYAEERARQNAEGREAGAWPESPRPGVRRPVFGVGVLGTTYKLYTRWIRERRPTDRGDLGVPPVAGAHEGDAHGDGDGGRGRGVCRTAPVRLGVGGGSGASLPAATERHVEGEGGAGVDGDAALDGREPAAVVPRVLPAGGIRVRVLDGEESEGSATEAVGPAEGDRDLPAVCPAQCDAVGATTVDRRDHPLERRRRSIGPAERARHYCPTAGSAERLIHVGVADPNVPDIDSFLLSVQERDKWRARKDRLEEGLRDARDQRRRLERRLSRVKRDLARTRDYIEPRTEHRTVSEHATPSFPFGR